MVNVRELSGPIKLSKAAAKIDTIKDKILDGTFSDEQISLVQEMIRKLGEVLFSEGQEAARFVGCN